MKKNGKDSRKFFNILHEVFLPKGYPTSVTEDYLEYQVWDSLQAFASSMNGALATQAVLKGVGVGNENATALAATITWLLKDGSGMVGRILFAWKKGTDLDRYSKTWRLVADILNDISFFIDIFSSWITYYPLFFTLLCFSSILRSIVGVAGGVTRTVVVQHQAIKDNIADVSAKDGSQETLLNLVSLVSSLILLPLVHENEILIWVSFIILTFIHLFSNYKAVRSLKFSVFNQETFHIIVREYINGNLQNLNIDFINKQEPLFKSSITKKVYLEYNSNRTINKKEKYLSYEDKDYTIIYKEDEIFINFNETSTITTEFQALFIVEHYLLTNEYPKKNSFDNFKLELQKNSWNLTRHQFVIEKNDDDI
uniref:RUS1 family protein C16orf58 homolog n=1 Tax=Strongyloides stercoralis TaxID=6248 RepID=A0A0K0EKX5_STRER